MSFDSEFPHQLYIGDVGEYEFEEINAVVPGGNHGWPECEGLCESSKTGFIDPIHEYARESGRAVIGGQVYRGEGIPSLQGKYIYADFIQKSIYALDIETPSSNGSYPVEKIANTRATPIGFFTDQDNEMYMFGSFTGGLYKIVQNQNVDQSEPSEFLSDTGCFQSVDNGNPVANPWVQKYEINQRFWSDTAKKERLFSIPEGTQIDASDSDDWRLPEGGLTIKHFRKNDAIFETRFLVRHDNGEYAGYTYMWNDDLSDATLVESEGARRQIADLDWGYPSRAQCMQCHTPTAGGTLSLESAQLNRSINPHFGGEASSESGSVDQTVDQIDYLIDEGYLSSEASIRSPAYPTLEELTDDSLPIDHRLKSYLHVNCSSCHRGERSVGRANWDARFTTLLEDKDLCGVAPLVGVHSVIEELIWPGNHQLSALWQRANLRGSNYDMPPIGSNLVDPLVRTLLAEWIDGLRLSNPVFLVLHQE